MPISKQVFSGLFTLGLLVATSLQAAERPTLVHTADPRPDILPRPLYWAFDGYRRRYNRPRDIPGLATRIVSPTSQEAMVWQENKALGVYRRHHAPPRYKRFYYPKPWEALQTGARPDSSDESDTPDGLTPVPDYSRSGEPLESSTLEPLRRVPDSPEEAAP